MGDKKKGWYLDIPKDPKQVASYSSSYIGKAEASKFITEPVGKASNKPLEKK